MEARDTATIRFGFLRNIANGGNNLLGNVVVKNYGSSDKYEFFSIPINWRTSVNEKPDTLSAVIKASQKGHYNHELLVDKLRFKKGNSFKPVPNGNFESWRTISSNEPSYWHSLNRLSLVTSTRVMEKTNDAYKGQFAAKVSTIFSYMNFKIGVIEKQKDLIPAHSFPDSIKGRCKYLPKGNDSAMVRYTLVDYQESIDFSIRLMGDLKKLGPASQYKPFQLPILYNGDQRPDSQYILFSSGHIRSIYPGNAGSELYLDELSLSFKENSPIDRKT